MCDEERLLSGARQLDSGVLGQIHDCFYGTIYRYVRYRTGNDQVAEDAAGEVFVRFLDALQNGKAPTRSLRGWLFGTANNVVNDHFRRHYKEQNEDLEALTTQAAGAQTNPEHKLHMQATHEELRASLLQLTAEQQNVITLRFGQGLSHREVARLMGKSEGAVKVLQFRALKALRNSMDPNQD